MSDSSAALRAVVAGVMLAGCFDVSLPPPPGPGSIQGRAVYATPGTAALTGAVGATVELRGTSLVTTITDDEGRFALPAAPGRGGAPLLIALDLDGDGRPDRQRLISLDALGTRDVVLGDVVLGRNARAVGLVRGRDTAERSTGHAGTSVLVEGMGAFAFTGDTGAFTLAELPEGDLRLSFFRSGYTPETISLTLRAGEEARLADLLLEKSTDQRLATARGRVSDVSGAPLAEVAVRAAAQGQSWTTRTSNTGTFQLDAVPPGLVAFAFEKQGFTSVKRPAALLLPGDNTVPSVVLGAGTSAPVVLEGPTSPSTDAGTVDAGASDAGTTDAGASDAGTTDAGASDAGTTDAGTTDAGGADAGTADAGGFDAGATDAGAPDAGATDAGSFDAGVDGGPSDAGTGGLVLPVAVLLPNGLILLSDGGALSPDGGVQRWDGGGGVALPAGAVLRGDGTVLLPDGRVVLPGGVIVSDDGGLTLAQGGLDAGTTLDCGGACSTGFQCTATLECRTGACALMSCAGLCQSGRCYSDSCPGAPAPCPPGDVCDGTACVARSCAGLTCSAGFTCAGGRCLSNLCPLGACGNGEVCLASECVHARCVDVTCPAGSLCVAGQCAPTRSGATVCSSGQVFLGGRCVDSSCVGVTCGAATTCQRGRCVSTGLIVAGVTYPYGQSGLGTVGVIGESTATGWRKLNVSSLPRILQLGASPDGTWLFALGDDGALRRSTDGVIWATVWSGSISVNGLISHFMVDPTTGELVISIYGFNDVTRFEHSLDNGSTFSFLFRPPQSLVRGTAASSAPGYLLTWLENFGDDMRALTLRDGGVVFTYPPSWGAGQLAFDPTGWGPTLVAAGSRVAFTDGGLAGMFTACGSACFVYAPAPSRRINAASANSVWVSGDHGLSWGSRSTTVPSALSLSSLVAGADGTLYAGNRNGNPPLIRSTDDGETWSPAGGEFANVAGLADGFDPWVPDANFPANNTVQPSAVNGHVYQRITWSSNTAGTIEPAWPVDGGSVVDAVGTLWQDRGLVTLLRVTAMTTRACGVGRLRCGGACVDVATSAQHCGGCDSPCAGQCLAGRCNQVDAGVLATPGCADGTREGFEAVDTYPDIAACAGRWSGALTDAAPDALCSAGFHVCRHTDTEPRAISFPQATAFAGCFAWRASNDGFDGCDPLVCQGDVLHDDMAGMGRDCSAVSGAAWPALGADAGTCLAGRARLDARCCADSVALPGRAQAQGCLQRAETGVVCCRD